MSAPLVVALLLAAPPAGWAWSPLNAPIPPAAGHPIDAFLDASLAARGLRPAPEADRRTLIRRVTFDLLGLPPTPEELDAFEADTRPDAYERLVERLLASPAYGERWARHWLDAARFGESHGFERDQPRDHAWRYRDFVVRALNDDLPYAEFARRQVAGDVLDPAPPDGPVASGFLVCGPSDEVGRVQKSDVMRQRVREEELEDIIAAVGQTFLGLTLNCARCHDHKFDPIPARDYYRLKAALEGAEPGNRPALPPAAEKARLDALRAASETLGRLDQRRAALDAAARERVRGGPAADTGLPVPLARWTFDGHARDAAGAMHGELVGSAKVEKGRLKLDGSEGFLRTAPLPRDVKAKTLEAWAALARLDQRGGGVLTLERHDGGTFDTLAFGERQPGQWLAGSDFFRRTRDVAAPPETAKPGTLVHVCVSYAEDGQVRLYRDGQPYGEPYRPDTPSPVAFAAGDARVLIGRRHTGGQNALFAGEVEEARLYDRALTQNEVAASFRAGPDRVSPAAIEAARAPAEREESAHLDSEIPRLRAEVARLTPQPMTYGVKPGGAVPPTFVLRRGEVTKPGERVAAGGLSLLPGSDFGLPPDAPDADRRRALAAWLTGRDNALFWRVAVNRVWQHHFGRGIVDTPNDFGNAGSKPTHPELLDALAAWFRNRGGSLKQLHRLILTSAVYRRSSRFDAEAARADAESRLLWRHPPRRLEGEALRDTMLAVGGNLNRQAGGPSFRPFTVTVFNATFYTPKDVDSAEFNRRTVYRMNVLSGRAPLLDALDCPEPSVKTPRRSVTTTPIQALALMNDPFVRRQAARLGERVRREAGDDAMSQADRAYRLALGRPPTSAEAGAAAELVREHGAAALGWVLFNSSEFLTLR
jgi:hypothetical protein